MDMDNWDSPKTGHGPGHGNGSFPSTSQNSCPSLSNYNHSNSFNQTSDVAFGNLVDLCTNQGANAFSPFTTPGDHTLNIPCNLGPAAASSGVISPQFTGSRLYGSPVGAQQPSAFGSPDFVPGNLSLQPAVNSPGFHLNSPSPTLIPRFQNLQSTPNYIRSQGFPTRDHTGRCRLVADSASPSLSGRSTTRLHHTGLSHPTPTPTSSRVSVQPQLSCFPFELPVEYTPPPSPLWTPTSAQQVCVSDRLQASPSLALPGFRAQPTQHDPGKIPLITRSSELIISLQNLMSTQREEALKLHAEYQKRSAELESDRVKQLQKVTKAPTVIPIINEYFDLQQHSLIDSVKRRARGLEYHSRQDPSDKTCTPSSTTSTPVYTPNSTVQQGAALNVTPKMNCREAQTGRPKKQKPKPLSSVAVEIMNKWYRENLDAPYPSLDATECMAKAGGITTEQVKKWFANKRMRSDNTRPAKRKRDYEDIEQAFKRYKPL